MWINYYMFTRFELGILKTQKRLISHWYTTGHAFANPTSNSYDDKDNDLAWLRTLAFLQTAFCQRLKMLSAAIDRDV